MGSLEGPYAKIFEPGQYPVLIRNTYKLAALFVTHTGDITKEDFIQLGSEALSEILGLSFEFPYSIEKLVIHTLFKDAEDVFWLHGWLFKAKDTPLTASDTVGQLSIGYSPVETSERVILKVLDIQMAQ